MEFKNGEIYHRPLDPNDASRAGLSVILESGDSSLADRSYVLNYDADYHLLPLGESHDVILPGADIDSVRVLRDSLGSVVWEGVPNYGMEKYGDFIETPVGTAWKYDRFGDYNPLYVYALRASKEVYVKPESKKRWIGVNPDYDQGIEFDRVCTHFKGAGKHQIHSFGRGKSGTQFPDMYAPDLGVAGPAYLMPIRGDQVKPIYKFDAKGDINPLFLQIRRSKVTWE